VHIYKTSSDWFFHNFLEIWISKNIVMMNCLQYSDKNSNLKSFLKGMIKKVL
jgi:hypothetical protein